MLIVLVMVGMIVLELMFYGIDIDIDAGVISPSETIHDKLFQLHLFSVKSKICVRDT